MLLENLHRVSFHPSGPSRAGRLYSTTQTGARWLVITLLNLGGAGCDENGTTQPADSAGASGATGCPICEAGAMNGGQSPRAQAGASGAGARAVCVETEENAGYITCEDGWIHRVRAEECPVPDAERRHNTCEDEEPTTGAQACTTDADCVEGANGRCNLTYPGGRCLCSYSTGCARDADCGAGHLCQCGEAGGRCVRAGCRTDADCDGSYCASYDQEPGCNQTAFACTQPDDACLSNTDCVPPAVCGLDSSGHRACTEPRCMI